MIRTLQTGQRCEVRIASVSSRSELLYSTGDILLEAPNWTLDGQSLILNGDGKLWKLDAHSAELTEIPLTGIPDLNNDHVLDPGGDDIFLSANDGQIYRAPLEGGAATRITKDDGYFHFLHGVSPDGKELAYVDFEQLLQSGSVDWFPHLSPDGRHASYLRFPAGTVGHPADLPVDVVLVSTENWAAPLRTWPLSGGQGTLNVNSWSPDSACFAFVAYPLTDPAKDQPRDA